MVIHRDHLPRPAELEPLLYAAVVHVRANSQ